MEAHDIGLGLLEDIAHSRVEGGAVAGRNRRGGINPELPVVGRQSFPPAGLACVTERRRRVAEKIEIYGLLSASADLAHLLANLLRIEHRARERAKRACFRCGCCEFPVHGACHRRLDDWNLDAEQLDETAIRPHICNSAMTRLIKRVAP